MTAHILDIGTAHSMSHTRGDNLKKIAHAFFFVLNKINLMFLDAFSIYSYSVE